jgi:hypothetical protein
VTQEIRMSLLNSFSPPYCEKHKESMVLYFYVRPNSAMGNGWSCRSCTEDLASQQTRFPEGAEL